MKNKLALILRVVAVPNAEIKALLKEIPNRDLLCKNCNDMLKEAKDDPAILRGGAEYLERNKAKLDARIDALLALAPPIPLNRLMPHARREAIARAKRSGCLIT